MAAWTDIDWRRPWLAPYRELGERAANRIEQGEDVAGALNAVMRSPAASALVPALAAGPLRFVDAGALPAEQPYETFIAQTAGVPTRHNLHDFFNGLVWLVWPALKRRLHEIQAEQIAVRGISGQRGAVRDAVTLFDENGALLWAPDPLTRALAERDWHGLFVSGREHWRHARIVIVGHALLEQLLQPRKPLCAHVWCRAGVPPQSDAQRAAWHGDISAANLQPKPFHPLPVLGVPGWWRPNESTDFYADAAVFRAPQLGRKPSIDR